MKHSYHIYAIVVLLMLPFLFSCSHEVVQPNEDMQMLSLTSTDTHSVGKKLSMEEIVAQARKRYDEAEKIDGMPIDLYNKLSPEAKKYRHYLFVISKYIDTENRRSSLSISEEEAEELGIPASYYKYTKASLANHNAYLDSIESTGVFPDVYDFKTGKLIESTSTNNKDLTKR